MGQNRAEQIEDLKIMMAADTGHLIAATSQGDRVNAHGFVDAIVDTQTELWRITGLDRDAPGDRAVGHRAVDVFIDSRRAKEDAAR